ncbi:MAG: Protein of unknown function precursor [Ferruginibacter sp.]|uniref:hypothetical protein n=1 Tax=Ferruginibacter sp. TaxID=1940288 RepID=UPI0026597F30|nr:hypothetical protein [Ferruginibacter sp.]MDB5275803.1 Protein of unknown function precursor [Ferruginibacter sp.]
MRKFYVATNPFKTVALIFSFFVFAFGADAAAINSTAAGGNWNATTTWVGGVIPGAGDDVTVVSGATVTVDAASNAKSLVVIGTLNFTYNLTIASKGTVTVNSGGTVGFNGTAILFGAGSGGNAVTFTLSSGANLITANTAGITLSAAAGSIQVLGTRTYSTGANYSYNGAALQVTGDGLPSIVNNLIINNSVGVNLTAAVTVTTLTIGNVTANSVLNDNGKQITSGSGGTLNLTSGTFNIGSGATATAYPGFTTNNIASGTTVNYNSTASQIIAAVNYYNLSNTVNGPRTLPASGTVGIAGTFSTGSGAYTVTTGSTVSFNGTTAQTIPAVGFSFYNLSIDNTGAGVTISNNVTATNSLALNNGVLTTTASFKVIAANSVSRTSGWVNGTLQRHITGAAASYTFDVGDATNYSPVLINYATTSFVAGDLTITPFALQHPSLVTSGISTTKYVKRYWTLTGSGGLSGTYDATFTFVAGDIQGGANTSNFIVRDYSSSAWSTTTIGTLTATSTKATTTGFGDFCVGESTGAPTVFANPSAVAICTGNNTFFTSTSSSTPSPTVFWQRSTDGTTWSNIIAGTDGGIYSNFASTTLTVTGATAAVTGYYYRAVFTNINGSVNSASAQLTVTQPPTITGLFYSPSTMATIISTPQGVTLTGTNAYTGGTFTASPGGLSIDASTGAITPSASTLGTYTVTYTKAAAGGCSLVSATTSVTISTASISYNGAPYCSSDNTSHSVTYNNTSAVSGAAYSASPSGLSISATGDILPSGSTPNTYTVTYSKTGTGAFTLTTTVTITALPTASIGYAGAPFCTSDVTAQTVTLTGTGSYSGGVFSSDPSLVLNTGTGSFTPNGSSAGSHTVTYTIPASGGCASVPVTTTFSIVAAPTATVTYAGSPYCLAYTTATPTVTGASGGTFSSTAGLTFTNTSTGEINPNLSTPGTYTVTYTIPPSGSCGTVQIQTTVTISANPTGSISYPAQPYCTADGPKTVTLTGTGNYTGGVFSSAAGLTINGTTGTVTPSSTTPNTYTVSYAPPGCPISPFTNLVEVDAAPAASIGYGGTTSFCIADGAPYTVTITGNNSGTFSSSPVGLGIDPATGTITPSTTTGAGSYNVVYTIPKTGNCGPVVVTLPITVTAIVATPSISVSGGTEPACQLTNGTTTTTYAAAAAGNTGLTWSLSNGSAGSISAGGVMTWANGFSGTVNIQVSASGCGGPSSNFRTVTISPSVTTPVFALGASSTRCQGAGVVSYSATATNATTLNYALDATSTSAGNTINSGTGDVTFVAGWSGTSVIIATATGCNGPLSANHTVTVTPTVGTPVFTLGASSTRCQGAGTVTYGATATNNTGITYSLDATTLAFVGNSIIATTGAVTYAAGWTGTSVITASATGCNGPKTAVHTVTITPTVTINPFSPATATRCQGAGTVTTTTAATNSTGITYSLDATTAGFAGNSIVASTGAVTYAAGWSGITTITASAAGCNGPATTTFVVTTNATSVGGTLSPSSSSPLTVCANANSGNITLTGHTGTITQWEKSTNGGGTWTNIGNGGNATLSYLNLAQTTLYRVLVTNGTCAGVYSTLGELVVLPAFTPVITPSATATCIGAPITLTASGYSSTGLVIAGGDFSNPKPTGWSGMSGNASPNSGGNPSNNIWGITNGDVYNNVTYNSTPVGNKFFIVNGVPPVTNPSIFYTPVFSTVGMSSAVLVFNQAYNLNSGAVASIQISTNGGTSWTTLQTYTGTAGGNVFGPTNGLSPAIGIDLNAYLGLSNLMISFNYLGSAGSNWALDNVVVTNSLANPSGTNVYNPLHYTWSPTTYISLPSNDTTRTVTVTPTAAGSITYTVSAAVGSCAATSPSLPVTITVNPLAQGSLTANGPFCGTGAGQLTFTTTAGTGPFTVVYNDGVANRTVNNVVSGTPFNVFATPVVATTTYTLVSVTDTKACSRTTGFTGPTATIIINPVPIVNVTASTICGGAPATITAVPATGATTDYSYLWTVPASATDPGSVSTFASSVTGDYRVVITNNATSCVSAPSATKTVVTASNQWTGVFDNDWQKPANWSCAAIPTALSDVIIPATAPFMPQLTAASFTKTLTLQGSAEVDLNGFALTNSGSVTMGTGTFKGSPTSDLSFDAAGSSTINFKQTIDGTTNALNNLTISSAGAAVTLNNKVSLYGALTPTAGALSINDELVLRSTSTNTAMVGQVGGTIAYSGSGKVTVERFIGMPSRKWHLFTTPVYGGGSIFDNWQIGGATVDITPSVAGKGTFITGSVVGTGISGNGLDNGPYPNSSLKVGDEVLSPVNNTINAKLSKAGTNAANIPYFLFVRGDRTAANFTVGNSTPTTLSGSGKLQTGTQTFTAAATSFTMIGNPYASPVDFGKLPRTGLTNSLYVWDPYLNLSGGYVTLFENSPGSRVYIASPSGSPGNPSAIIQSGQAFYVYNPGTADSSLVIDETAKSTVNNQAIFRPMSPNAQIASLATNLYAFTNKDSLFLADGNLAQFNDSYNPGVDWMDAKKMNNTGETFSLLCNGVALAANRRPLPAMTDTLFYQLTRTTAKKYQFQLIATNLDQDNLAGFVQDQFTHINTPINMNGSTKINFAITSNKTSAAVNRFRVVFKPSVVYTNVAASVLASDIGVQWNVASEENIKGYEIERSTDGTHFTKVADQASAGNSEAAVAYNWLDVAPALGQYYYRIRSISYNDVIGYSNIVKVKLNRSTPAIYVFPNPVTENTIHLQMNGMAKGVYAVRLMNNLGQVVVSNYIAHMGGTATETITPANKILAGIYQLEIAAPDKKITTVKVIVQ